MSETAGTKSARASGGQAGHAAGGHGGAGHATSSHTRPLGPIRRTEAGKAIGSKMAVVETDGRDKTRKVVIHSKAPHPKYGKYVSKRTVLHVHDENNESHTGDVVEIAPCRPISKTKTWRLVRVVERRSAQ